mgnify:FL=1
MSYLPCAAALLLLGSQTQAASQPTGYDIAKRAHDNNAGYGGERFQSQMDLYDAKGSRVVSYELTTFNREHTKAGEGMTRSLVRLDGPPDTKGTAH